MKANKILLIFIMSLLGLPFVHATTESAIQQGGLIVGIGFFAFLSFYFSFNMEEKKHFVLRYLFLIFGVLSMYGMTSVFAQFSGAGLAFYKLGTWILRLFFAYIVIYIVYEILKWKNIIGGNGGV